jgi:hypothetical protein
MSTDKSPKITPQDRYNRIRDTLVNNKTSALDCMQDIDYVDKLRTGLRLSGYFGGEHEFRDFLGDLCSNERELHRESVAEVDIVELDVDPIDFVLASTQASKRDMCSAVLKHTVWQVKRKMLGLKVTNHVCVVLYSAEQGSGKSTFWEKFLSPLHPSLWGTLKFNELSDDRAVAGIAGKYINLADELQGASKSDVDALKNFITSTSIEYRPLGTNGRQSMVNKSTIIGATNTRLKEQIKDSGMRRYFEIECLPKLDWSAINSYDFTAYWASVDPRAESPLVPHLAALKGVQAGLTRDPVAEWFCIGLSAKPQYTAAGKEFWALRDLLKDLSDFAKQQGMKVSLDDKGFATVLRARGWTMSRSSIGSRWSPPEELVTPAVIAPAVPTARVTSLFRITANNTSTGYPGADDEA